MTTLACCAAGVARQGSEVTEVMKFVEYHLKVSRAYSNHVQVYCIYERILNDSAVLGLRSSCRQMAALLQITRSTTP